MKYDQRPRSVTWLAFGVLISSVVNILRIIASFDLPPLQLSVPAWYFPVTGAIWGGIAVGLSVGLYIGKKWASRLTRWLSLAYVAWYWIDRILFVKTDYARGSIGAAIVTSIIGLSFVFWTLLRPKALVFFKEKSS